jgi:hypothetical protein
VVHTSIVNNPTTQFHNEEKAGNFRCCIQCGRLTAMLCIATSVTKIAAIKKTTSRPYNVQHIYGHEKN